MQERPGKGGGAGRWGLPRPYRYRRSPAVGMDKRLLTLFNHCRKALSMQWKDRKDRRICDKSKIVKMDSWGFFNGYGMVGWLGGWCHFRMAGT